MNRKFKLPNNNNNNKMKANDKFSGKMKRKFLSKFIESQEILNNVLIIGESCLNKRISFFSASSVEKDKQLKQVKDDRDQLKELIKWYNNELIEEHHEKHDLFKRAFEMPYDENINRLEFVKQEFDKCKTNESTKFQRINDTQEWSKSTLSPILKTHNSNNYNTLLTPLQLQYQNNLLLDKISVLRKHGGSESPNSSFCSTNNNNNQSINCRFNQWHKFDEKTVTNRICNDCLKKVSRNNNKQLYKCKNCGIYIHDCCRESNNRKLCFPLVKLPMKLSGERTVELKDLCSSTEMEPMVPSILLCLMHHIQTFGMRTQNLYRSTPRDKDVKELCERLMEGKPKFLSQCEIQTVASCLRFVLRSLKNPLLSDYIIKKLIKGNSDNLSTFSFTLQDCLSEMDQEFLETFVYLMIHLKKIADNDNCGLDGRGLANIFAPSIISNEMSSNYLTASIAVIEKLIAVDHEFYKQYLPEDIFFHNVHAQLNASTHSFWSKS